MARWHAPTDPIRGLLSAGGAAELGVVAPESIRDARCFKDSAHLDQVRQRWKRPSVALDDLQCFEVCTNSTASTIRICARKFRLSPSASLRDQLLELLARSALRSETLALAADVVSIDARFNANVAEKKRAGDDVDVLRLAEMYENWLEACAADVQRFKSSRDERLLSETLRGARDALRRSVTELGGAF